MYLHFLKRKSTGMAEKTVKEIQTEIKNNKNKDNKNNKKDRNQNNQQRDACNLNKINIFSVSALQGDQIVIFVNFFVCHNYLLFYYHTC